MKYFIFCSFVFFISFCKAQNGSVSYSYILNANSNNIIQSDHILYFNGLESTYYTSSLSNKNKEGIKLNEENIERARINNIDTTKYMYYRNLNTKFLFCRGSALDSNLKHKPYLYKDHGAHNLSWILKDEYKTISDYKCQKATVNFRGRSYEAWFTTEIPLPYGPWKLGGLPGLILEVYDLSKEVSFTVENIIIPDPTATNKILKPTNGTEVTHKEFVASRKSKRDKIRKAISARLPKGAKLIRGQSKKYVLELEYEWSKE